MIHIVEIGHMKETNYTTEIGHIVETGTTPKNTKETIFIEEIGYHKDFRDQRHKRRRYRDYHENKCEDGYTSDYEDSSGYRYDKGKHRISYKNRGRSKDKYQNKNKNRDRDDSYDQIIGMSKEKDYLCDDDDIFHSKMERVHKILQTMSQEKEITI